MQIVGLHRDKVESRKWQLLIHESLGHNKGQFSVVSRVIKMESEEEEDKVWFFNDFVFFFMDVVLLLPRNIPPFGNLGSFPIPFAYL